MYFVKDSAKTGITSQCRECIREYDSTRLDVRREYMSVYRKNNRESIRCNQKKYDANNRDKLKEYILKNKEKLKKYYKVWYKSHYQDPVSKEKYRQNLIRRRTRKNKLPATLTAEEWVQSLEYFNYKDAYTGLPMNDVSKDHIIPLTKGGGYTKQNIVPCENSINKSKNGKDMETWYRNQSFFSEERLNKIKQWQTLE